MPFNRDETVKLQRYLQRKFGQPTMVLRPRQTNDSLEILLDGEFLGVVYKDEEDGETAYNLNISVLDIDLDDA
jgi:hypothetical protein